MKNVFKQYLIPHTDNQHQPYLLRSDRLSLVLLVILAVELLFAITPLLVVRQGGFSAEVIAQVLVSQTNEYRATDVLPALTVNPKLVTAAENKAQDMVGKGYFAHTSPQGVTPWHWLDVAGYSYQYAGENLAVNFFDSSDVAKAWMNSPAHRANMLSDHFTEIGIAVTQGQYQGRPSVFVVQFFGRPARPQTAGVPVVPVAPRVVILPKPVAALPANSATPTVAGAQVTQSSETFIAVAGAVAEPSSSTPSGSSTKLDALSGVIAHPRSLTETLLLIIGFMIVLAAILKLIIKFEAGHAPLLINALIVIVLIVGILLFNYYLFTAGGSVF